MRFSGRIRHVRDVASASAGSLIGTFHNLDSAQKVAGGPVPRTQLPGRFAVELSSVHCDLTGPPNNTDLHCSDRSRLYPFVTDSGISFVPSDPIPILEEIK